MKRPLAMAKVVEGVHPPFAHRLFRIKDRRHGQNADPPANRNAIDPARGSVLVLLDTDLRPIPLSAYMIDQ